MIELYGNFCVDVNWVYIQKRYVLMARPHEAGHLINGVEDKEKEGTTVLKLI